MGQDRAHCDAEHRAATVGMHPHRGARCYMVIA